MLAALGVAACGGGGDGGKILTRSVAVQRDDLQFIWHHHRLWQRVRQWRRDETDEAAFNVDDNLDALESDLDLGMVVAVTGTVDDDGVTGTADNITFDHELEGP